MLRLLLPLWLVLSSGFSVHAAQTPNIIFILVDDMGWGDTSVNAGDGEKSSAAPRIQTPTLEKMARLGTQLRRHYTAAPVCAPARASLFSGVHQGHAEVIRNNNFDAALENSHTLASVLKQAGYATALIGKWGIGGGKESGGTPETAAAWPTKRGFDYFFGYHNHLAGHRHYPKEETNADPDTNTNAVWDGDKNITADLDYCYSTDLFTARAKKWIVDQRKAAPNQPFFLALTLIAPHARLAVPAASYPKGGGLHGGVQWLGKPGRMINTVSRRWDTFIDPRYANNRNWEQYARERYGANAGRIIAGEQRHATMVSRIDQAVGDIINLCHDLRIADNTFIVFTSDNGPHNEPGAVAPVTDHPAPAQNPSFFRSYGPFDGIKRDTWEGGLRIPCLVYAPGFVKKGHISRFPSQFHDWMATFAELAGIPKPMRCDGVSLLPTLRGDEEKQRQGIVYSEYFFPGGMVQYDDYAPNKKGRARGEQQIIIFSDPEGRALKAIRTNIRTGREDFEIYDVENDPQEAVNLAERYADKQEELKAAVLHNRRAFDYRRDSRYGIRRNPCQAQRSYDGLRVPANKETGVVPGLSMRRIQANVPWTPDFDTLPGAPASRTVETNVGGMELPAGSVTELKGFLRVPEAGDHWHFYLTMDNVPGSKAYVKMHNFQLIDADFNYKPGTTATESAAINADEGVESETGKKGIPLEAGLHEITLVLVQGAGAPGHVKLEWNRGLGNRQTPKTVIPDNAYATLPTQ